MTSSQQQFYQLLNEKNLNSIYQKPTDFKDKHVIYGTAGFRMKATHLDWIMYRIGMLACLRSVCLKSKFIGCMITASHNPQEDNGCKLVDPTGDMLDESWESFATEIVNSNDLCATLTKLCSTEFKHFIDTFDFANLKANVIVAHDTRPSCGLLLEAFKSGVSALNGTLVNYGLLSTPQLHYMVRCQNTNSAYGQPNEEGYFNKLSNAFFNIWSMIDVDKKDRYDSNLYVDGSNGVGALKAQMLTKLFESQPNKLNIHLFNEGKSSADELNHLCGADFVKVQQKPPSNLPVEGGSSKPRKYCSLDGDADRVVYYYLDGQKFNLLDGDKISTLVATHLRELVEMADLSDKINLCIVQTAYANGSSTDYIQNKMRVNVSCVPTGVKYLHHEAQKADIGVYFEANGHGTVLFSEKAEKLIDDAYVSLIESANVNGQTRKNLLYNNKILNALYNLKHLKDCINQTVGDAISDFLLVELILASRNLSVEDWNALYTDLPSRQLKVSIKDRTIVKTYDAERRVSSPSELQVAIDNTVKELNVREARAFVRPSGTEDVVRVYAEADTQANADALAKKVCQLVFDLAGGVGARPQ